jgi:hypothetical protein
MRSTSVAAVVWLLNQTRRTSGVDAVLSGAMEVICGSIAVFVALGAANSPAVAAPDLFVPGRLFVADSVVKVFEPTGTLAATLSLPTSPGQAGDVAFNYVRDVLYVADRFGKVHVFDRTGAVVQTFPTPPSAPQQLVGIAVDDAGTAYVAGSDGRVHVYTNEGIYNRSITVPNQPFLLFVALSPDQTTLFVTESNYFKGVHYFDLTNGDAYVGMYVWSNLNVSQIDQPDYVRSGRNALPD